MKSYHPGVWVKELPINTRSGQPFVMAVSGQDFNSRLINDQINTVQRTYVAQTRRFSGQSEETINGCTNRVFTTAVIISDLAKLAKVLCDNDNRRNPLGIGVSEAECFHEIVKDEATVMQMGCDMLKTFAVELIAVTRCNTTIGGALEEATRKDEVERLKSELKSTEVVKQLAVNEAVAVVEKQCDALKNNLERVVLEGQLEEKSLKDRYETQLRDRDDAIERLKDIKEKLSTKMVGETLEQHCEIESNRLRATLFPRAYFEKDSDVRGGSKGDYIFRDSDESGTEFISIMFEMKNESDMTATKKKTRISSGNLIKTVTKRAANTPCSCRSSSRTASSTMRVSSMFPTAFQRCISFVRGSLFRLSTFCGMRHRIRCRTRRSSRGFGNRT